MSNHIWEQLVEQIEQERNPIKVAELAKKLNDAMLTEEKERVKRRLGIATDGGEALIQPRDDF